MNPRIPKDYAERYEPPVQHKCEPCVFAILYGFVIGGIVGSGLTFLFT